MVAQQIRSKRGDTLLMPGRAAYGQAMEDDSSHLPRQTLTETLFVVFLRIVALGCLWLGLQYWAMLVGYSMSGSGRFDLLNLPWRTAAASLAVIFPVAALGLWLAGAWGPVIWVIAAGTQILMYGFWTNVFGSDTLIVAMHGLVAVVYLIFRLALWLESRDRPQATKV